MVDQNEEDYLVEAEEFETEEDNDEKRGCFRTVALVIIILLLLLLFWPVKSDEKSIADSRSNDNKETTGDGVVGDARYTVLEADPVFSKIGGRVYSNYKATLLGVRFRVENIASMSRTLDFSMVEVKDQFGNKFVPYPLVTELWYEDKDKRSPWGEEVEGQGSKEAMAFFFVYVSPEKKYSLLGRDFDWRDDEFTAIEIGKINALRQR